MLTTLLFALEIKFVLKIDSSAWEFKGFVNKWGSLVFALFRYKALWKRLDHSRGHFFRALAASILRALKQNRAQPRFLYFFNVALHFGRMCPT